MPGAGAHTGLSNFLTTQKLSCITVSHPTVSVGKYEHDLMGQIFEYY